MWLASQLDEYKPIESQQLKKNVKKHIYNLSGFRGHLVCDETHHPIKFN